MSRVVHFEIPSDQPERSIRFYQDVFGWQIEKWTAPVDYWLIMTGDRSAPGIDGGLMRRREPGQPVVNTIEVPSVDEYCEKVAQAGGQVVVPKHPIPGVGYLAYFKDPDGNIFGMVESDESAR